VSCIIQEDGPSAPTLESGPDSAGPDRDCIFTNGVARFPSFSRARFTLLRRLSRRPSLRAANGGALRFHTTRPLVLASSCAARNGRARTTVAPQSFPGSSCIEPFSFGEVGAERPKKENPYGEADPCLGRMLAGIASSLLAGAG